MQSSNESMVHHKEIRAISDRNHNIKGYSILGELSILDEIENSGIISTVDVD